MGEAMGYVLSLPGVSTVVVGCTTPAEVDEDARIARCFKAYDEPRLSELEERTRPFAAEATYYKRLSISKIGDLGCIIHKIGRRLGITTAAWQGT
jgi:hypothetical protein